jgi:serine/threonine-protein kinase
LARNQALSRMTMTGEIVGTLHYLAPEQVTRQEATTASDIYSLGAIFYELVTGTKPFVGETPIDIVKQIVETAPLRPKHFRPELTDAIDRLIGRMLDKDPVRRPSGDEVVRTIKDCR